MYLVQEYPVIINYDVFMKFLDALYVSIFAIFFRNLSLSPSLGKKMSVFFKIWTLEMLVYYMVPQELKSSISNFIFLLNLYKYLKGTKYPLPRIPNTL